MKYLKVLAIAFFALSTFAVQAQKWSFDNSHSSVNFAVSHMVISETTGSFDLYDGSVVSNSADFSDAQVEFKIDVNSINTKDEKRDGHLRSPDFFNTEKHPNMTFESTKMKSLGGNKYELQGNFTMLGVTKPITLNAKYNGTVKDPWGNTKAGFKVTGTISRNDYGLKYNSVMDSGGMLIGEEVEITCNIELVKN